MGLALDTIVVAATNPGAGGAAAVAVPGDSLAVRAADQQAAVYIENVSRLGATAGFAQVVSPRMHDVAHGLRLRSTPGNGRPLLGWRQEQKVFPQDVLGVTLSGGAAEVDGAALMLYYTDMGGVAARLFDHAAIEGRMVNLVGVEVATVTAGVAFNWADTAINATFDNLKADTDYAVLGYQVDTEVLAVAVRGPDTGNLRAGGPGTIERTYTEEWFVKQNMESGRPYVPVINAANKAGTFVSVAHSAVGAAVVVNLLLAELHS